MTTFRLTQLALADLRSIGRYTQTTWGREQRNRYLAKLDECFHLLAEKPLRGIVVTIFDLDIGSTQSDDT